MMSFRVTVLGSGTIIPSMERRTTALLVEADGNDYLLDCGPGILDALEETGSSFRMVREVLITHFHPDHTLGIGHLLAAINNDEDSVRREYLGFYGPAGLTLMMGRWYALYPSVAPRWDYLKVFEVSAGEVPVRGNVRIEAAPVSHGDQAALAYRMSLEGASMVYTGDTEYTDTLVALSNGTGLLVAECSMPDSRPLPGHMTPSSVGRLAREANVGRVVLVHLYPVFDDSDPVAAVRHHYKGPVAVAADGMVIDVKSVME